MDIGKKCLIMAIIGTLITIVSSPFMIKIIFTGKPFTIFVEKEFLDPFPPTIYGPVFKTIDEETNLPYSVMEFILSPTEEKKQYKVILNVETNDTIHILIASKNSTENFLDTFNAGTHTRNLQIRSGGIYVLNITSTNNRKVNAGFKITESWSYLRKDFEEQPDILKTALAIIGFIAGIAILIAALVKLRKAVREAPPVTVKRVAKPSYVEVEEEEEE